MSRDAIVWGSVTRALKTCDALALLADAGYGEQSTMLARSLVEDTVTAWWCSTKDPEALLNKLEKHEKSVTLHVQRERDGREHYELLAQVPVLEESALASLADEEGVSESRARGLWTGKKIEEMARSLRPHLSDADAALMEQLTDLSYLLSSLVVHPSPVAMSAAISSRAVRDGLPTTTF